MSIKTKQVLGFTGFVLVTVVLLSLWYLSSIVRVLLVESQARAKMVADATFHRAYDVVAAGVGGADPAEELHHDAGLRSILQAGLYAKSVEYAAIVDTNGVVIAHNDETMVGRTLPTVAELADVLSQSPLTQAQAIYTTGGQTFEVHEPLLLGTTASGNAREFGSIRVGISTLLIREDFTGSLRTPIITAGAATAGAVIVSLLLAQLIVRPIHVIRSGLARLGRGELNVDVDLPGDGELGDLGASFKAVSARLAAGRTELEGQRAALESVVEHLEDAVALFGPSGNLLFANPAMRTVLSSEEGTIGDLLPAGHPYRTAVESTLRGSGPSGPTTVHVPESGERLLLTHVVEDPAHGRLGVMLVVRNLAYLSHVESTLSYSRKLAALGRLSAGIAHEVKNPLNATMIHLELLKMQLGEQPAAREHLAVIAAQVRRLDDVVQGFLKFTRPEDVKLQPVTLASVLSDVMPVINAEAGKSGVDVRVEFPSDLPSVNADASLLAQAFLNLALNACQAMPNGGRLRIAATPRANKLVEVVFEDNGVGIPPENLARLFDLYFTTKEQGSGIGLSLVYRTVQLLDGEIEVQSTPGRGTTFRVLLRQA